MFKISVLYTITDIFTHENKMWLQTRIKIITKKKNCFQKFSQPYLFMADEGKQKNPKQPQDPLCCIWADFYSLGPLADQVRRCTGINSLVLSFFMFLRWSKPAPLRLFAKSPHTSQQTEAEREAPSSLSEEGTRRLSLLINCFFETSLS